MSEEILKALTQLFAIISKQDGGVTEGERNFVIKYFHQELDTKTAETYIEEYDKSSGWGKEEVQIADKDKQKQKKKLTKMGDSVRILGICKRVNKTLNQRQKAIVLIKLLEMLASDRSFTEQRMMIIQTVAEVFNIKEEYPLVEKFVIETHSSKVDHEDILIFDDERPPEGSKIKFIDSGLLDGEIIFMRMKSVGLYFCKYTGDDEVYLNNQIINRESIIQFAPGSIFKTPKGAPLYYADLVNKYNSDLSFENISFNANNLQYQFPNGHIGLRDVSISEGPGSLIGIMGASGAGKTTLLNVLAGLEKPSSGTVLINGYDIFTEKDSIEGVIGYISQDDLLIEELTVYQNLYYNAKLCFKDLSEEEIDNRVVDVLTSLGLDRIGHLKVGSPLNKKISGGQRKRLNIALELIREPAVMFVDEPTSGLSSRDSENVIDLLKELSFKGKLIFVVIHQPSSDIYKMFDKMLIMDTGGYPIFYGNPIEAVIYFKSAAHQVDNETGQCPTCGNVNPEQIFNIIEARVVDEYGDFTDKRRVIPPEWNELYLKSFNHEKIEDINEEPPKTLKVPSKLMQAVIFTTRDFLSKVSDKQYLFINLLEAPLLALLLSLIIRYRLDYDAEYVFRHNDNIPAYILIAILVALFMGLTVSAEEIISDRKILKREAFLNLSRSSYLVSKVIILFSLSAIQTFTFVLIGNIILDIEGLGIMYWLALFTISCHANVLGLNISSAFNSAVTVYILIPILLIPQMVLSGLIFDFDKLNNTISDRGTVPLVADIIASRWGYEAIAVEQFRSNEYQKHLFDVEEERSFNYYKKTFWIPEMEEVVNSSVRLLSEEINDSTKAILERKMNLLKKEFEKDNYTILVANGFDNSLLNPDTFSEENANIVKDSLRKIKNYYNLNFLAADERRDSTIYALQESLPEGMTEKDLLAEHYNDKLADLVTAENSTEKIALHNNEFIQITDPIYNIPPISTSLLNYRTHFFAPKKHFLGKYIDTYVFNILVIWFMTTLFCFTLYFELLAKFVRFIGNLGGQ